MQSNSQHIMKTTTDLITKGAIKLVALRDEAGHASGSLFVDDGESLDNLEAQKFDFHDFKIQGNQLFR